MAPWLHMSLTLLSVRVIALPHTLPIVERVLGYGFRHFDKLAAADFGAEGHLRQLVLMLLQPAN